MLATFGSTLTGAALCTRFWAGRSSTQWARNWSSFYSEGSATFAVTQEEDWAFAEALGSLSRAGRANASRLLVLRAASDYSYEPDGADLSTWFFSGNMVGADALQALFLAGAPVVRALAAAPADGAGADAFNPLTAGAAGLLGLLCLLFVPVCIVLGVYAWCHSRRERRGASQHPVVREVATPQLVTSPTEMEVQVRASQPSYPHARSVPHDLGHHAFDPPRSQDTAHVWLSKEEKRAVDERPQA